MRAPHRRLDDIRALPHAITCFGMFIKNSRDFGTFRKVTSAIEDGASLAATLARADWEHILEVAYEAARLPRTSRIQAMTPTTRLVFTRPSGVSSVIGAEAVGRGFRAAANGLRPNATGSPGSKVGRGGRISNPVAWTGDRTEAAVIHWGRATAAGRQAPAAPRPFAPHDEPSRSHGHGRRAAATRIRLSICRLAVKRS